MKPSPEDINFEQRLHNVRQDKAKATFTLVKFEYNDCNRKLVQISLGSCVPSGMSNDVY